MIVISLSIITIGVIIFFFINLSLSKFLLDKRLKYGSTLAYALQIIGLVGLIVYNSEFIVVTPLHVEIGVSSPDFVRAIAELLWPLTAMVGIFWFLPQILEFLKDPRKTIPLLNAFAGKYSGNEQQKLSESVDISQLPEHSSLSVAQKETIAQIESDLRNFPPEQERSKLLIRAANSILIATFERIYNVIFGSQIQALQILSTNPNIDISSFYELHKQKTENAPEVRFESFDMWANLLLEGGLAVENSKKFTITNKGIEFLQYLHTRNYYLLKGF